MYINSKNGVKRLAQVNFTTYEVTLSVAKPIMAQQKKIATLFRVVILAVFCSV